MAGRGGWYPRIDFPTSQKKIYYYREGREKIAPKVYGPYDLPYINVAKNILKDSQFEDIPKSWGVKQIKSAAGGSPPGMAPSFWISVRMEIHMLQQLKRLALSY
jgi:hypothetical protein